MRIFAFLKSGKKLNDMQAWDIKTSFCTLMAKEIKTVDDDSQVILIDETRFNRVANLATEIQDGDYAIAIDPNSKKHTSHKIYVEASPHFSEFLMRHTDKSAYEAILLYDKEEYFMKHAKRTAHESLLSST